MVGDRLVRTSRPRRPTTSTTDHRCWHAGRGSRSSWCSSSCRCSPVAVCSARGLHGGALPASPETAYGWWSLLFDRDRELHTATVLRAGVRDSVGGARDTGLVPPGTCRLGHDAVRRPTRGTHSSPVGPADLTSSGRTDRVRHLVRAHRRGDGRRQPRPLRDRGRPRRPADHRQHRDPARRDAGLAAGVCGWASGSPWLPRSPRLRCSLASADWRSCCTPKAGG